MTMLGIAAAVYEPATGTFMAEEGVEEIAMVTGASAPFGPVMVTGAE